MVEEIERKPRLSCVINPHGGNIDGSGGKSC